YIEDGDQLSHLPNYQHTAITNTVEEIKWLLRDEIASAQLHTYPLTEQTLEMVCAHVKSSKLDRNCIYEAVPLNFVCGMEQSRTKFMQDFGCLSVSGHHLECEGSLYYLAMDKTQPCRRNYSSLVPPLGFKNQFFLVNEHLADQKVTASEIRNCEQLASHHKHSIDSNQCNVSFEHDSKDFESGKFYIESVEVVTEEGSENKGNGVSSRPKGSEKEKWENRTRRKERRDSERRGSVDSTDSESDVHQLRSSGFLNRELSNQPSEGRTQYKESLIKVT
ncbi:unnamed protein product, partial [Meganyctiphanes norvegica]